MAFAVSAALCGLGAVLTILLLPSRLRLEQFADAASASAMPSGAADTVSSGA